MRVKIFTNALLAVAMLGSMPAQAVEYTAGATRVQTANEGLRAEAERKSFFVAPLRYEVIDEAAKTVEVVKLKTYPYAEADIVDVNAFKNLVIPETVQHEGVTYTVTSIGRQAFGYQHRFAIETCKIPNTVTIIKEEAFAVSSKLKEIVIPDNVETIESGAYTHAQKATVLKLGAKLKNIDPNAFHYLFHLKEIQLSAENKNFAIKDGILYDKDIHTMYLSPSHREDFTSYTVPNTVTEIAANALVANIYLKSITLPEGLKKIGTNAFLQCSALETLELPASLEVIEQVGTLKEMDALSEYRVAEGSKHFAAVNGILYSKDLKTLIRCPEDHPDSLNIMIPKGTEKIGESAFEACKRVVGITIPESVTTIEGSAFEETGLRMIKLPSKLETISKRLFFRSKYLEEVHIGAALTAVLEDGFTKCDRLSRIHCAAPEPPRFISTEEDYFNEFPDEIEKEGNVLTVPVGAREKYADAPEWSRFKNIVESEKVAIEEVAQDAAKISVSGNRLTIKMQTAQPVEVYDFSGVRVYASEGIQEEVSVVLPTGAYIVKCADRAYKVQVL